MSNRPSLLPVLSVINTHFRDAYIEFQDYGHKYTITCDPTSKYTSVTTWNHSHFPKFNADLVIKNMMKGKNWKEGHKYWGMTKEEIKKQWFDNGSAASGAGTNLHFEIECFMNDDKLGNTYTHKEILEKYYAENHEPKAFEWEYFINFVKDFPDLKPYRTEWLIYHDDLKLAGSIDMVYEKPNGNLAIYDWKRSKDITKVNQYNKFALTPCINHLPDANFWHYALQLNTYKAIIEAKYDKKVDELFLVRLHPEAEESTYELLEVPDMQETIQKLFEIRQKEIKL